MNIGTEIFSTLKGFGFLVELYDATGKGPIASPELAEYVYARDKKTDDSVMIRLPKEETNEYSKVVIYKSHSMDDKFKKLLMTIKNIAISHGDTISIRQFGRNIEPKDLAYLPKGELEVENMAEGITESFSDNQAEEVFKRVAKAAKMGICDFEELKEYLNSFPDNKFETLTDLQKMSIKELFSDMCSDLENKEINEAAKYHRYGTTRSSYHVLPEAKKAKVIIRHSKKVVDEEAKGARSRNVKNLYVESINGERRLIETKSLMCARAIANHVNSGGKLFDDISNKIIGLSEDMKKIKKLKRKYPVSEDASNKKIHESLTNVYEGLLDFMKQLNTPSASTLAEALNLSEPNVKFAEAFYSEKLGEGYDVLPLARGSVLYTKTRKFLSK